MGALKQGALAANMLGGAAPAAVKRAFASLIVTRYLDQRVSGLPTAMSGKNTIVYAGGAGGMMCLLNQPKEELVRRWNIETLTPITVDDVREFEFDDEIGAYDIWPIQRLAKI